MTKRQTKTGSVSGVDPGGPAARTRHDHAQELAQDYAARGNRRSGVRVNRTIHRLRRAGFVSSEPYRPIFLTSAGQRLARESRERHEVVVRFLVAVGVPPAVAEYDAEGIEHHVSRETLRAFREYLESPG